MANAQSAEINFVSRQEVLVGILLYGEFRLLTSSILSRELCLLGPATEKLALASFERTKKHAHTSTPQCQTQIPSS